MEWVTGVVGRGATYASDSEGAFHASGNASHDTVRVCDVDISGVRSSPVVRSVWRVRDKRANRYSRPRDIECSTLHHHPWSP